MKTYLDDYLKICLGEEKKESERPFEERPRVPGFPYERLDDPALKGICGIYELPGGGAECRMIASREKDGGFRPSEI